MESFIRLNVVLRRGGGGGGAGGLDYVPDGKENPLVPFRQERRRRRRRRNR